MKKLSVTLLICIAVLCAVFAQASTETVSKGPSVLKVGVSSLPTNMDPRTAIANNKLQVNLNVYDTLMYVDAYGNGEVRSYICDSWETIDDYSIKLTLKDGISFHNGAKLTSEDVKYTIETLVNGDTTLINSNIKTLYNNIENVEIVDEKTFIIKSRTPDPALLTRFTSIMGCYIIPKGYVEEVGNEYFGQYPIGTGPYKVVEYSPEKLILEYYEGYYGEKPAFDRVEYLLYPETATRVTALLTGEIDMCFNIGTDDIAQIEARKGYKVDKKEVANIHVLQFNTAVEPMDDINFRKALSLSIDRQTIADTLWSGYAKVLNGYNFPLYGAYYVEDYPEYVFDPELAKEYLDKSDYAGEQIIYELKSGYYTLGNEVAEAIVAMWNSIGINAVVEYSTTYKYDEFHVHNWSNGPRFFDPSAGLWLLWGEGSAPDRHNYWEEGEERDEFMALGEVITQSTDFQKRYDANKRMMEIYDDLLPGTVLFQIYEFCGMDDNIIWTRCPDFSVSFRAEHLQLAD